MAVGRELLAVAVGFGVALVTAPVGVSGAVFLLPVQLSGFGVPNPRVTPTNLLYNVVAGPGALLRFARDRSWDRRLARSLLLGSVPGVVLGAVLRVHVVPGPDAFRLVAAAVLVPVGLVVLLTDRPTVKAEEVPPGTVTRPPARPGLVTAAAFVVGTAGGIYGIGGGSLLGPLLVAAGFGVRQVAPVALLSTFVTSIVGVGAFAVLATTTSGTITPDWALGLALGLGGLAGGYCGARLQPRLPERGLRRLLGVLAIALAVTYTVQALR